MLKTWKPRITVAALVGTAFAVGCFNFDNALSECVTEDRCEVPRDCVENNEPDPPDDTGIDSNCDGIDGVAAAGLFVDPERGDNNNPGTKDQPLKTIRAALELLRGDAGQGFTALYLGEGSYDEDGLVLDRPVSLFGAYGGLNHNWKRDGGYVSFVDGGVIGLTVNGLKGDAGVRLDHLSIASADSVEPGSASIALRVLDSQDLRLHHLILSAGRGATGAAGSRGDAGIDGPDGGFGSRGGNTTAGSGGGAPIHMCGTENHSGGGGRSGGKFDKGFNGNAGQPLIDGGTPGGMGGDAGGVIPVGSTSYNCEAVSGQDGAPGNPGTPGGAGPGGSGTGEVLNGTWVATAQARGGAGTPGTAGAGGGGGGSGGSCPEGESGANETAGGGGSGGGGGGGCGGQEGQGGEPGGASIALLLNNSTVDFGEVTLATRGGGTGGPGGEGGEGGKGGFGGPGGDGGVNSGTSSTGSTWMGRPYYSFGGHGAAGGNGGEGGPGGPGGGGAGGPSVGVWCWDGGVGSGEGFNLTTNLSPGGTGGSSKGTRGADGPSIPSQDCNPSPP